MRPSSSEPPFQTGAMVTDCVNGERNGEPVGLDVPGWIADGSPSLEGVQHVGSVFHRAAARARRRNDRAPVVAGHRLRHETELTALAQVPDRRPTSAAAACCRPARPARAAADNPEGNGGLHCYRVDRLRKTTPATAARGVSAPTRASPSGKKAIYRAPIRTGPQAVVLHGARVPADPGPEPDLHGLVLAGHAGDRLRRARRTARIELKHAGWFIPTNANTWVSAVFKYQANPNGTFTYWGATGDFNLGVGRSAIDIWKVTLPAPPKPGG